ncbi:MAG TPA: LysM peptidoglycan-binding domain-containing protein [Candidatus Limnocylindria bacterium]
MQRPRFIALVAATSALIALGPTMAAVALAADPTIVVQTGDTLTAISKRVHVPMSELIALNALADPDRILAGQTLRIGTDASVPAPAVPTPTVAPSAAGAVHVVQAGENLTWIARRYGVSVDAIVAANGIANPSRIYGGQQLTIPGSSAVPAPAGPSADAPTAIQALMAERDAVRQLIVEESAGIGVPASFALAVAWQESGWQQSVVSHAGAVGIMQLMPATAVWVGEAMLGTPVDMYDARQNVRAGVRLLAHYLGRYGGSHELALAAYYQGQRALDLHGIYPVSRPYIASVLALEALFGG